MEQRGSRAPRAAEGPTEPPAVAPWIAVPSHCAGCSVEKTEAPRCEHCGAAIRAGGYTVLRTLSQGPHGRVYEALGPDWKRVALKELIFSLVPDAATLDAFQREAELLRSIQHPQIPRLLAAFSEGVGVNTRLYLAQELVEGMSLEEAIARAPLSVLEARRLARQVLRVLEALHGRDPPVLHRDIKPANLILRPDGVVSLVDFGSARLLARGLTHGATLVGTFGYMPPEQLGGTVDASCDVYALGATLLHALTGKRPEEMTRDGLQLDADRHLKGVDPALRRVIKRMVAASRADRFKSAGEALDALKRGWQVPARARALLAGLAAAAALGLGDYALHPETYQSRVPGWQERLSPKSKVRLDRSWWSVSVQFGPMGDPLPPGKAGVRVMASPPDAEVALDGRPLDARGEQVAIDPGGHEVKFFHGGAVGSGRFGVRAGEIALVQGILMAPRVVVPAEPRLAPPPAEDRAEMGMLALSTREPGVEVYLDGKPTGRFTPVPAAKPLVAKPGLHAVQFLRPGGLLSTVYMVRLTAGEVATLRNVQVDPAPPP